MDDHPSQATATSAAAESSEYTHDLTSISAHSPVVPQVADQSHPDIHPKAHDAVATEDTTANPAHQSEVRQRLQLSQNRLLSLDLLRGLAIFVMITVNAQIGDTVFPILGEYCKDQDDDDAVDLTSSLYGTEGETSPEETVDSPKISSYGPSNMCPRCHLYFCRLEHPEWIGFSVAGTLILFQESTIAPSRPSPTLVILPEYIFNVCLRWCSIMTNPVDLP
ncbi:hypothetical protein EDD11_007239 [Mortierella claussenii]|nr:hypothetical protein EDD11_007239 [Mortierella claussenii]